MTKPVYSAMTMVAIIEDDDEIRDGIQKFLNLEKNMACDLAAASVEEFLKRMSGETSPPDIILMDIGLPGMSGISGMKLIKEKLPDVQIIMLTIYNDPHKIFESLCAGASGYLLKNTPLDQIKESIDIVVTGGAPMSPQIARKVIEFFNPSRQASTAKSPLSDREKEIVIGLVDGLSYKMIADRMKISIETVRFHIKKIYEKLQVHSKSEVIRKSFRGEI